MAEIAGLPASLIYVDTAPLIYVIEEHPEFAPAIVPILREVDTGRITAVSSYLTLTEVLVKPLEQGRNDLAKRYKDLLTSRPHLRLAPVDADVALKAAGIRATGVRLADAIHLATATLAEVDIFLTNDDRLKRFDEIRVVTVSEI